MNSNEAFSIFIIFGSSIIWLPILLTGIEGIVKAWRGGK